MTNIFGIVVNIAKNSENIGKRTIQVADWFSIAD